VEKEAAIAALVSLEQVERILVASLKPTDVVVVELNEAISVEAAEHIQRTLRQVFPSNKIVICDQGTQLKVVSGEDAAGAMPADASDTSTEGSEV
jgi:hypothetical protein